MKKNQKIKHVAWVLSSLLMCQSVFATPPTPTVDETLYVNLDYYGDIELANIVKTYTLNGNQTIKDEGVYSKVTNMTDMTRPVVNESGVTWEFKEPLSRFYFEGQMDTVQLPWLFDVSYELNGVPIKAEELAGAQGYVEIIIHVTPNPDAAAYYLENMLLQIAATFNMDKCLSLEAEGAQIQTMGSSKMIMFMALPGETQTFKIGIGTESFETGGISMMMVPAKMQQLEMISGFDSQIPVVEDAAVALNNSLDLVLGSVHAIQANLDATKQGLQTIYDGMEGTSDKLPDITETHDQLMEELKHLLATMDQALPQFETAETLLDAVYSHGNNLLESISGTGNDLRRLEKAVDTLEDTLDSLKEMGEEMADVDHDIELDTLHTQIKSLQQTLMQVQNQFYGLGTSIENFQETVNELESFLGGNALGQVSWILGDASRLMNGLAQLIGELEQGLETTDHMFTSVQESIASYEEILENYAEDGEDGFKAIQDTVKEVSDLLGHVIEIQEEIGHMGNTMNSYQEPIKLFLETVKTLATNIRNVLDIGITQVENIEGVIEAEGPTMSEGMKDTLTGMMETLDSASHSLGALQGIQKEKDVIANIVSGGWQQLTQETNLLKIDPNAPIQSITSKSNPSPETLQIVVRTKEISLATQPKEESIEEPEVKELTLWEKIKQVFQTVIDNVKTFFNKIFNKG